MNDQVHTALYELRSNALCYQNHSFRSRIVMISSFCLTLSLIGTLKLYKLMKENSYKGIRNKAVAVNMIYHPKEIQLLVDYSSTSVKEVKITNLNSLGWNVSKAIEMNEKNGSHHLDRNDTNKSKNKRICEKMCEWQSLPHPTCNSVHEIDLLHNLRNKKISSAADRTRILGIGGKRIAWLTTSREEDKNEKVVFKTLLEDREFDRVNLGYSERDAIASDMLSFSPHVVSIYGYCAIAAINQKGYVGADRFFIDNKKSMSSLRKLYYVKNAARALADVHGIVNEETNETALVHGDIRPWNFMIMQNKQLMLHDLNAAKFRGFYSDNGEPCQRSSYHCNRNKPPEECIEGSKQTEKIDVHGLGNFIFFVLSTRRPYTIGAKRKDGEKLLMKGILPQVPSKILKSKDPAIVAMREMMTKCLSFNANDRPTAAQIATELQRTYDHLSSSGLFTSKKKKKI